MAAATVAIYGRPNRKYPYIWHYDRERRNSNGKSLVFGRGEFKESARDDSDNDQQPEVAIWLPRPDILITYSDTVNISRSNTPIH